MYNLTHMICVHFVLKFELKVFFYFKWITNQKFISNGLVKSVLITLGLCCVKKRNGLKFSGFISHCKVSRVAVSTQFTLCYLATSGVRAGMIPYTYQIGSTAWTFSPEMLNPKVFSEYGLRNTCINVMTAGWDPRYDFHLCFRDAFCSEPTYA